MRFDADVGVAFLAQTVTISGSRVLVARRQPFEVDASTPLIAVTRIQVDDSPAFSPTSLEVEQKRTPLWYR